MEQQQAETTASTHSEEHSHPTPVLYVQIALILLVVTIVEVWLTYLGMARGLLITLLLVLSAAKFAIVVMFYMHLKYDAGLFKLFFVAGLTLATAVLLSLMALFRVFA